MSFQDVGRINRSRRSQANNRNAQYRPSSSPSAFSNTEVSQPIEASFSDESRKMYAQTSDAILQYQKNVGLLENMNRQVGTKTDGPVLETQFKVQLGVINELGAKIEKHLRSLEINMASMSRTEASRCRATHVKLTRDFRTVETKFRKLELDTRRKRDFIEAQRRDNDRRMNEQNEFNDESMQHQMLMQDNRLAEEIMREREEEIRNINKGMHQVNEIYRDLAEIVGSQQGDIDTIETTMEASKTSAERGLAQVTKANQSSESCVIS